MSKILNIVKNVKGKKNRVYLTYFIVLVMLVFITAACGQSKEATVTSSNSNQSEQLTDESSLPLTTTVNEATSSLSTEKAEETTPTEETILAPSDEHPVIALTFDDGPSLRDTGKLLDLLATEEIKATFFVLGQQVESGREDLVKRAFEEGHEIGSHAYSHTILTTLGESDVRAELEKTGQVIEGVTGMAPTLMRPPTGAWSDEIARISSDYNLAIINWDWISCPEDWNHHDNPEHIAAHVIENAQNGHIILLHDTNEATIAAMPAMIAGLKERGFRFMTVSDLLSYLGDDHPQAGKVYHTFALPE